MNYIERTISNDDVLSRPITVDGLDLDAHVSVVVRQARQQDAEVTYLDIRSVHIVGGHSWGLIEIHNFAERHPTLYKKFVSEVEALAIRSALATKDSDWDEVFHG